MSENKRPLVLWSGGFDSTALVIDLLHQGDIDVMYVSLENNRGSQHRERKAVTKLKCIIADANLIGKIVDEHTFGYEQIYATKAIYAQPALWLNAAAYVANSELHDSVQIAYVKGDDVWHYKTEVKKAYKALNKLISDLKVVPLAFPYEWRTKQDVLDILTDFVYHKQVMNTIRYCETQAKEQCGECTSCKRHASEIEYPTKRLMEISMNEMLDEFERDTETEDEYNKEKADA